MRPEPKIQQSQIEPHNICYTPNNGASPNVSLQCSIPSILPIDHCQQRTQPHNNPIEPKIYHFTEP